MSEQETIVERERPDLAEVAEGLKFLQLWLCTDMERLKYGIPEALKIVQKSLETVEFRLNLEYLDIIKLRLMHLDETDDISEENRLDL